MINKISHERKNLPQLKYRYFFTGRRFSIVNLQISSLSSKITDIS